MDDYRIGVRYLSYPDRQPAERSRSLAGPETPGLPSADLRWV